MEDRRTAWILFGVIALTVVALFGWGRFNHHLADQGFMSEEFVVNWVAARALIVDGESPYQPEVTRRILTVLGTGSAPPIGRVPQFTSPLYTILVLLPFAFIADLNTAQTLWLTTQQVALVILILLSVYLSPVKPGRWVFSLLVITTFIGFHAVLPIYTGSPILLTTLFLLLSVLSIKASRDEISGVFLGLATIQIPYVVLPILLILLWTLGKRRRLVAFWFLGTLLILFVLGILVLSDWPLRYLGILFRYSLIFPVSSPGVAFRTWWPGIGMLLSWILTAIVALGLIYEWWSALRGEFHLFLWVFGLTLTIGMWTGLPASPQNLIVLLLPLVLCVSAWSGRWGRAGSMVASICLLIVLVWEWWLVYGDLGSSQQVDALKLLIPLPTICLMGLFWVRWVIVHPKRLLVDEMRTMENG